MNVKRMKALLTAAAATMMSFGAFAVGEYAPIKDYGGTFDRALSTDTNQIINADATATPKRISKLRWQYVVRVWAPKGQVIVSDLYKSTCDGVTMGAEMWNQIKEEGDPNFGRFYYDHKFTFGTDGLSDALMAIKKTADGTREHADVTIPDDLVYQKWFVIDWFDKGEGNPDNICTYVVNFDPRTLVLKDEGRVVWSASEKIEAYLALDGATTNKTGYVLSPADKPNVLTISEGNTSTNGCYWDGANVALDPYFILLATNNFVRENLKFDYKVGTIGQPKDYRHAPAEGNLTFSLTKDKKHYYATIEEALPNGATIDQIGAAAMNDHDVGINLTIDFNRNGIYKDDTEFTVALDLAKVVLTNMVENKVVTNWPAAYFDWIEPGSAQVADEDKNKALAVKPRTLTYSGDKAFVWEKVEDGLNKWKSEAVKIYAPAWIKAGPVLYADSDKNFGPIGLEGDKDKGFYVSVTNFVTISDLAYATGDYVTKSFGIQWGENAEFVIYTVQIDVKNLTLYANDGVSVLYNGTIAESDKDYLGGKFINAAKAEGDRAMTIDGVEIKTEDNKNWKSAFSIYAPKWFNVTQADAAEVLADYPVIITTYTNGTDEAFVSKAVTNTIGELIAAKVVAVNYDSSVSRAFITAEIDVLNNVVLNGFKFENASVKQEVKLFWGEGENAYSTYTLTCDDVAALQLFYKDGSKVTPLSNEREAIASPFGKTEGNVLTVTGPLTNNAVTAEYAIPVVITLPKDISTNNLANIKYAITNNNDWAFNEAPLVEWKALDLACDAKYLETNGTFKLNLPIPLQDMQRLIETNTVDEAAYVTLSVLIDYYGRDAIGGKGKNEADAKFDIVIDPRQMAEKGIWDASHDDPAFQIYPLSFEGGVIETITCGEALKNFSKNIAADGKSVSVTGSNGSIPSDEDPEYPYWHIGVATLKVPTGTIALSRLNEEFNLWAYEIDENSNTNWYTLGWSDDGTEVFLKVIERGYMELLNDVNGGLIEKTIYVAWQGVEEHEDEDPVLVGEAEAYSFSFDYTKDVKFLIGEKNQDIAWPLGDVTKGGNCIVWGDSTNFWSVAADKKSISYAGPANVTNGDDVLEVQFVITCPESVNRYSMPYLSDTVKYSDWDEVYTNMFDAVWSYPTWFAWDWCDGEVPLPLHGFDTKSLTITNVVEIYYSELQTAYEAGESYVQTIAYDFDFDGEFETEYTVTIDPTKVTFWSHPEEGEPAVQICPLDLNESIEYWKQDDTTVPGEDRTIKLSNATIEYFEKGVKGYNLGGGTGINVLDEEPGAYVPFKISLPQFAIDDPERINTAKYYLWDSEVSGLLTNVLYWAPNKPATEACVYGAYKMPSHKDFMNRIHQGVDEGWDPFEENGIMEDGKFEDGKYTLPLLTIQWSEEVDKIYYIELDLNAATSIDYKEVIPGETNMFLKAATVTYDERVTNFLAGAGVDIATLPQSVRFVDNAWLPDVKSDVALLKSWMVTPSFYNGDSINTNEIWAYGQKYMSRWPYVNIDAVGYTAYVNGEPTTNKLDKAFIAALKDGDAIKFVGAFNEESLKSSKMNYDLEDNLTNKVNGLAVDLNGNTLTIEKGLTLLADTTLGGGAITNEDSIVVDGCTLTLAKAEIVAKGASVPAIIVRNGGALVVDEDSSVELSNSSKAVATISVEDGTVELSGKIVNKSGSYSVVKTSGAIEVLKGGLTLLRGAKVDSTSGLGIFADKGTELAIMDGEVTGASAVYFAGATLTVAGGTLTGNGVVKPWMDGTGLQITGDALVIDATAGDQQLAVFGGQFKSLAGKSIAVYPADATVTGFVTDGVWGDISFEKYLAEDHAAMMNDDEATRDVYPFAVDELVSEEFSIVFTNCEKAKITFTKKDLKKGGKYEGGIELGEPEKAKPGYEFAGWMNVADGQTISVIHDAGNYQIEAQWTQLPFDIDEPDAEEDVFTGKKAKTYYGNIVNADGQLVGTVTFKTTKVTSKGKSTVSATVKMFNNTPKSYTVKATAEGVDGKGIISNLELTAKNKTPLMVTALSDSNASGTITDVNGGALTIKSAVAADDQAIGKAMGQWNIAVRQTEDGAWANFTVSVSSKGKATIKGNLADGTAISQTAYAVAGVTATCVPFVCTKANLAFEIWFTGNNREINIVNTLGVVDEPVAAFYGKGEDTAFEAGTVVAEFDGEVGTIKDITYQFADKFYGEGMKDYPYAATISTKGKMSVVKVAKAEGAKKAAYWSTSYTAKTGAFSGKAKVYGLKSNNKETSKSLTLKGKVIDGAIYGTGYIKAATGDIRTVALEAYWEPVEE